MIKAISVALLTTLALPLPAAADLCDDVAAQVRKTPPTHTWSDHWKGLETVEDIYYLRRNEESADFIPVFADDRTQLLAESASKPENEQSVWQAILSPTAEDLPLDSKLYVEELKSAGVGYVRSENGGTAHCEERVFYYRANGEVHVLSGQAEGLVQNADGKMPYPIYCNGSEGSLFRLGGAVVYAYTLYGDTHPHEIIYVSEWRAPHFETRCRLTASYDYRYVSGGMFSPPPLDPANPRQALVAANIDEWARVYRPYYDHYYDKGGNSQKIQAGLLSEFTSAHPEMADTIVQLRPSYAPTDNPLDFPVIYNGQPVIVTLRQGWYSGPVPDLLVDMYIMQDGKPFHAEALNFEPQTTGVAGIEIVRP